MQEGGWESDGRDIMDGREAGCWCGEDWIPSLTHIDFIAQVSAKRKHQRRLAAALSQGGMHGGKRVSLFRKHMAETAAKTSRRAT